MVRRRNVSNCSEHCLSIFHYYGESVQHLINGQEQNTALPFVYALLKSKIQEAIRGFKVFENTKTQADSDELKIHTLFITGYISQPRADSLPATPVRFTFHNTAARK